MYSCDSVVAFRFSSQPPTANKGKLNLNVWNPWTPWISSQWCSFFHEILLTKIYRNIEKMTLPFCTSNCIHCWCLIPLVLVKMSYEIKKWCTNGILTDSPTLTAARKPKLVTEPSVLNLMVAILVELRNVTGLLTSSSHKLANTELVIPSPESITAFLYLRNTLGWDPKEFSGATSPIELCLSCSTGDNNGMTCFIWEITTNFTTLNVH